MRNEKRPQNIQYEDCTIPPGMTVREWRSRKARSQKPRRRIKVLGRLQRSR